MSTEPLNQLSGLACRRLRTPEFVVENVYIEFDGNKIAGMGDFQSNWLPPGAFNAREDDLTVIPGLVDVHVHGAGGVDFLNADQAGLEHISKVAASGGCTSMVATTTLSNDDKDLSAFERFVDLVRENGALRYNAKDTVESKLPGTRVIGIHLEGPFLNPDRRGAFTPKFLRTPDVKIARRVMEICGDLLLKVTMAPELPNGEDVVRVFTQESEYPVEVSIGHSTSDYAFAMKMFEDPRVRQVTHMFNAMNGLHHRAANMITAALLDSRVMLEIIADGLHVSPPVVQLLHQIVGADRLIAITDGASSAGMPTGSVFQAFSGEAKVHPDSGVRRTSDHVLVGSAALMHDIMLRLQRYADVSFKEALLMSTVNPAKSINRYEQIASVDKGKLADFVILRDEDTVVATIRDGKVVYKETDNVFQTA